MKQITIFLFFIAPFFGVAQEKHILSGVVQDENNEALLFGDVLLRTMDDQKVLKITYIENGHFEFDPLERGDYQLEVSCLSYEKFTKEISLGSNENIEIQLKENTNELEEITITGRRNFLTNKNGNQKIAVANSILAAEATTMNLLSMLPKIMVGADGRSLSVIGKGNPLIYLGQERISVEQLNTIPVSSIKDIELINYPSAKYEAEGRAVILITRKKGYGYGIEAQISEVASWKRNFNNYFDFNISLKKKKVEWRANTGFHWLQPWEGSAAEYDVLNKNIYSIYEGFSTSERPVYLFGTGVFYEINKGDYVSINTSYRSHKENGLISSTSFIAEENNIDDIETFVDVDSKRSFFTSNLNYNKSLTSHNANLFFGIQYSDYVRAPKSEVANNYNETEFEIFQLRDQSYDVARAALRVDFEKTYSKRLKWELGSNIASADGEAFTEIEYQIPVGYFQSNYDYKEINYAAYSSISGEIPKMSYSAGLRVEQVDVEAGFRNEDTLLIDRQKTQFFPKLQMNISIDSSFTLTLNYAKTINRPHYLNASSITTYISPFHEFSRNVNLKPTISEEFSANLGYKNHSIELAYTRHFDPVFYSVLFNEETSRLIQSPQNIARSESYSVSIVNAIQKKKYQATNFVRMAMTERQDPFAEKQKVKPNLYIYTRHVFTLPHQFKLGLTAWANSKLSEGLTSRDPIVVAGLSLSKSFKNKLHFTLNYNDIFKTFKFKEVYNINQVETFSKTFTDRNEMAISIRYTFGKTFKSTYKNKDIDDGLNRMR